LKKNAIDFATKCGRTMKYNIEINTNSIRN